MKKRVITAVAIALLSLTSVSHAQRAEHDHEARFERMRKHLELTDEQASQIHEIMQASKQRMEQFHEDGELTEEERESMHTLRMETRQRIAVLLNDEQKARFREMKKHHHRKGEGHRHN